MNILHKTLYLLGFVSRESMGKLIPGRPFGNETWFFVDYAENEHRIGSHFRTQDRTKYMTLAEVYLPIGRPLTVIPQGYQTVCRFVMPLGPPIELIPELKGLKTMDTFDWNPDRLLILELSPLRQADIVI